MRRKKDETIVILADNGWYKKITLICYVSVFGIFSAILIGLGIARGFLNVPFAIGAIIAYVVGFLGANSVTKKLKNWTIILSNDRTVTLALGFGEKTIGPFRDDEEFVIDLGEFWGFAGSDIVVKKVAFPMLDANLSNKLTC